MSSQGIYIYVYAGFVPSTTWQRNVEMLRLCVYAAQLREYIDIQSNTKCDATTW